jgi:nucleotide-binding universal stress UspA family protein
LDVFRHLLVPLDGSRSAECAVPYARAIASRFETRVTLLRVVGGREHETPAADERLARLEAEAYLRELAATLAGSDIRVDVTVEEGQPGEVIVGFATAQGCDLIVLTERGAGRAAEFAPGGTSHKILQGSGTSILLVRRVDLSPTDDFFRLGGSIAVLTDGSERSEWAMSLAASLARGVAELVLVHAVPPMTGPMPRDEIRAGLEERLREAAHKAAGDYLERMRRRLATADLEVRVEMVSGPSVTRALLGFLNRERPRLIVISAHGASGGAPWPYGGVAANLLLHSPAPVLVLQDRPSDGDGRIGRQAADSARAP